jgi:23S rRNA pseudouridine1911/1915/1917 synthase
LKILIEKSDTDIGKRLDLFLSIKLPQISRSNIKKTIESNKVNLNGVLCYKAGYKVRPGDLIDFPDIEASPEVTMLPKSKFDLEILFEDEDYLFINKPSGLIVHPTNPGQKDTLVNKLLDLNQDLPANHILRPGIVHRLDKDTSGVIVVAKSPKGLWWLSQQFADRKVKKDYVAIGLNPDSHFRYSKNQEFEFEGFMRRSSTDRKQYVMEKVHARSTPQGRFSKSLFKILGVFPLGRDKNIVYSNIFPMTGRTHQIRVHQKELGFVIMGDDIYMPKKQRSWASEFFKSNNLLDRLYLHAHSIRFESYNGKLYSVTAPLPPSFTELIACVGKNGSDT